jgi:hypothetical protein
VRWAQSEGLERLAAEHGPPPSERLRVWSDRRNWRRSHDQPPGLTTPVYLVGLQRSGTNALLQGLERLPEVDVRNESDWRLFHRFRLRSDQTLRAAVMSNRHRVLLVKPLCDSHRVTELLDLVPGQPGRAVWVYRDVLARSRSAVTKFGDHSLAALAAGLAGAPVWQLAGASPANLERLRSLDLDRLDPLSGAAVVWYLRNSLYFELGLHLRADVLLVSYEQAVTDPAAVSTTLTGFFGLELRADLLDHLTGQATQRVGVEAALDPTVRGWCDELSSRLDGQRARADSTAAAG